MKRYVEPEIQVISVVCEAITEGVVPGVDIGEGEKEQNWYYSRWMIFSTMN